MKWNEFFRQSLEDKVLQGKLSLLRGGLRSGWWPAGAEDGKGTLFITFSLSHLSLLGSDGVRWSQWGKSLTPHFLPQSLALGLSEMIFGHPLGTPWRFQRSVPLVAQVWLGAADLDWPAELCSSRHRAPSPWPTYRGLVGLVAKSWWMIESFRSLKHGIWNGLCHVELVLWNIISWCLIKMTPARWNSID